MTRSRDRHVHALNITMASARCRSPTVTGRDAIQHDQHPTFRTLLLSSVRLLAVVSFLEGLMPRNRPISRPLVGALRSGLPTAFGYVKLRR